MNTQLNIYATSGGSYLTSGTVHLYEDVPISLNYNIADIKSPQKRNADYSKTITVPGTNNNCNLFSHIYEIGIDRLYNPNKKVEARILFNGCQVMRGWLRLVKIRTLRNEKVEFDLEITGRLDDLFTSLVDKKLTDLSWSDLDHVYNRANIITSWSTPVGSGYVYPFIDHGYSIDKIHYDVNHFFPAVYIKEALDRAFSYAGFQYSSAFLTSTLFKSLIMPFTSDRIKLSTAQVNGRQFRASRLTSNQQYVFSTSGSYEYVPVIFNDDSTTPNADLGSCYDTTTGVYTVPSNGNYFFRTKLSMDGVYTPIGANQYINGAIRVWPRLLKNGVAIQYGANYFLSGGITLGIQYSTEQTSNTEDQCYVTWTGFLNAGDTISIDVQAYVQFFSSGTPNNVNYKLRIKSETVSATDSYFYATVDPDIKDGDTVTFADTLPPEMKIVDFIVSIFKMFNLYFEYDKNIPNKIYIEPREDYYNSTIQDWSNKMHVGDETDTSKDPEIIPMGALNAKRYRFTYRKDGDVLNNTYSTTYGENYGERYKDVDNDFLKNHEVMELIFSPTPLYSSAVSNRIYPAIVNVDASLKIVHNKTSNPRILYYGGLKNCDPWIFTSLGTNARQTQYPYAGHLDDPTNPTVDLNFGVPKEIYYTPTWQGAYTNNNVYNVYWKKFIDEITDYNSSIVTAWFWLKPVDMQEVDFRHVYRFMNQNFRLNKIYDYNPSERSLTKCEFIKLKNGIPFVAKTAIIIIGSEVSRALDDERVPKLSPFTSQGGNSFEFLGNNSQQIYGINNFVAPSSSRVLINGDNNSVGELSENVSIQSSSGVVVAGGLVNVSVFNSSGLTVVQSNTNWVNNLKVNGLDRVYDWVQLKDDAYIDLPAGVTGYGLAMSISSEAVDAVVHFRFNKNGGVTEMHTADALNAAVLDTDTKLCAFNNSGNVRIKNRLGASKIVMYVVKYINTNNITIIT